MTTKAIEAEARAINAHWSEDAGWDTPFDDTEREYQAHCRSTAKSCIEAAIASGELVPASAVAAERERCAKVADKKAAALLATGERLSVASQATKLAYTEVDLHEQAGVAIKGVAVAIRALSPEPASGEVVAGWRPIETCPRDGEGFLATCDQVEGGFVQSVYWDEATNSLGVEDADISYSLEFFTHWMPLPVPPAMLRAATKDGERK